ncbi:MAG: hypothetical protein LBP80_02515 [Treponema sp.]|nr:hypothetical protein [Treponema sp.]
MKTNTALVNVETGLDTSRFAVVSIRAWWQAEGSATYPQAEYRLKKIRATDPVRLPRKALVRAVRV